METRYEDEDGSDEEDVSRRVKWYDRLTYNRTRLAPRCGTSASRETFARLRTLLEHESNRTQSRSWRMFWGKSLRTVSCQVVPS